jgi:DNA polymerase III epsilon subunit-like protein
MAIQFYVLDLETNGLMCRNNFHEICEFSIIRAADRMELSRQVKVDHPENSSIDALKITGKTVDQLRNGINKNQLIQEVENFLNEDNNRPSHRCIVGHNVVNFDRKFLWQLWEKFNKSCPFNLYLDTMHMFRDYSKNVMRVKKAVNLNDACITMGIKKYGQSHNAKDDTRNTYLLWQELNKYIDFLKHIKNMPHILK